MNTGSLTRGDYPKSEAPIDLATVFAQIEESLRASQHALLVRDLEDMERQTATQVSLGKVLAEFLQDGIRVKDEARGAAVRLMHLGRVQLGVLRRAQRSSRMLSYLLVYQEFGYGNTAAT